MSAITHTIVHAIPGRVRFRVPWLGNDANYASQLQKLLDADERVIKVRINRHAASVAVTYKLDHYQDSLSPVQSENNSF